MEYRDIIFRIVDRARSSGKFGETRAEQVQKFGRKSCCPFLGIRYIVINEDLVKEKSVYC